MEYSGTEYHSEIKNKKFREMREVKRIKRIKAEDVPSKNKPKKEEV